jgi:hypothetical protein
MNHPKLTIKGLLGRKLAIVLLVLVSAAGAFATLGDGRKKTSSKPTNTILSGRTAINTNQFSLKSGYSFKGSQVLNSSADKKYFNLNTVVTLQRGNTTYTIPLKKKAVFDKVKIEIGNQQLRRN